MINVLGIDVPDDLLARWREWFAPEVQPFPADDGELGDLGRTIDPTPEVQDTFYLYSGERVWWPRLLQLVGDQPVIDYVEEGVRPSRHRELSAEAWRRTEPVLPGAADLSGTFPSGSGPNCFGTVMAAAGVPGAESEWMFQEPFEKWLAARARPIHGTDHDQEPGVVLVWRNAEGLAVHAAVTIGDGYALSKPSQAWCSPRVVWTVRETTLAARHPGSRLWRYLIVR